MNKTLQTPAAGAGPTSARGFVRGPEPGPVAFLDIEPLAPAAAADEDDLLVWLLSHLGPHEGQDWWLHLEHTDDGYAVGRYTGGRWTTEATSRITPRRILDGRCFSEGTELRFWEDTGRLTGVRLSRRPDPGHGYPATYAEALAPSEEQCLTRAGDTGATVSAQGFRQLRLNNGSTLLIPCPPDGDYTLTVRTYYRADTATGTVSIGAVCAAGYRKAAS